jgi:serine/threonine-protein kinase
MLGRTVSHYDILEKLGEGGMGVVYRARDVNLGRFVALKLLPRHLVDSREKAARFRQEARAISALNHPHIATIYGFEEADGAACLVLEYLPGGSLRQKMAALKAMGQFPSLRMALDWTMQMAEGLSHAHRRGIIHRDIKASNILFTEDDRVKIADFGLAKMAYNEDASRAPADLTQSGAAVGTPACMSPEQALGGEVDQRSDLFSLGIILFELITGEMPFQGSSIPTILHEIVYAPAAPLSSLRNGVSDALQRIVSKALEKNPAFRYQTADDLLADLHEVRGQLEPSDSKDLALEDTVSVTKAPVRRSRAGRIALAAAIVAGALLPAAAPDIRRRAAGLIHWQSIPAEQRIAVLPFANIGDDPRNQALVDGLMEVVTNSLTRLEQSHGSLLVVPASDVRSERTTGAHDAWKKFGANLAITGSVERSGATVRVTINLVDTRKVTQLRTDVVRANLSVEAISDGVVKKVAHMLDPELEAQDRQTLRAGETSLAAADRYYVEGLGYLHLNDRPENIDHAINDFNRALVLDRNYVLAYAGVAQAYRLRYDKLKDPDSMGAALTNASRAVALNSRIAAVHITMGMVEAGMGQYEKAEPELRLALKLEPRNADAYRELAAIYEAMRQPDKAEKTFKKAIDLRPRDWWSLKQLALFYYRTGKYSDAARYFRDVIVFTPDSANAYSNLAGACLQLNRKAEAVDLLRQSIDIEPTANACNNLGVLYYFDGRFADAAAQFETARDLNRTYSIYWGNLADAYRWAPGLADKAPNTYEEAIKRTQEEIRTNPRSAAAHARIAMYWAALGFMEKDAAAAAADRRQAASEIARAISLDPSDGGVQYRAALVYEQGDRRELAVAALRSAIRSRYSLEEIRRAPPLKELIRDSRIQRLLDNVKRSDTTH